MTAPHLRKGRPKPRERYFCPVPRGLEPVLLAEMQALGLAEATQAESGAFFTGTLEDCYRANLWLRTPARVLRVISDFPCTGDRQLYNTVRGLDWFHWLSPEQTLAVRARLGRTGFTHAQYLSRKIKDAVVDRFREAFGQRPSVDPQSPDVQVHAWFHEGRCTLSLDSSGPSLFKRGYRHEKGEAPLKENLAAGLIGLTGWRGERPFCDFMAGSGTLAIEAALVAANRAPGLTRERFGFMRWPDYHRSTWTRLRNEAEAAVRPVAVPIVASDANPEAIAEARRNAERAGVADAIEFSVADFREREAPAEAGMVLVNPPYGERLGEQAALADLYRALGDTFKQRYKGWEAFVFTVHGELIKSIGLRPSRRTILYNGPLECRLLHYRLY